MELIALFRELNKGNVFSKLNKRQSFIIIFAIVLSVSSISTIKYLRDEDGFQLTVLVHGESGKDELILPNRGIVKLLYGDAIKPETINNKGEATFKEIPSKYFKKDSKVEIFFFDPEGEPYRAIKPDSLYQLVKGKYISLEVKLYGLNKLMGIVKNFNTGDPISGVRVSINGIDSLSNQFGEYMLLIPPEFQQKFQTVRAFKDGYEMFEIDNVALQTEKECPIFMKPKS